MIIPIDGIVRPEWSTFNDETSALQDAIDSAANTGAIVSLRPTVYTITRTLNLHSGTVIEGTICGFSTTGYDNGTIIRFSSQTDSVAIKILCQNNSGGTAMQDNAIRFRLSNFSLNYVNTSANNDTKVGIQLVSDVSNCSPRNGEIKGLRINNFDIGIDIEGGSYVTFKDISIGMFTNGIRISSIPVDSASSQNYSRTIEFLYFDNISMECSPDPGNVDGALGASGLLVESGNNLYFRGIDINDCEYGMSFISKKEMINIFVKESNISRCIKCLYFEPSGKYMTRFSIEDISLVYSSWHNISNTTKYAGIWFEQKGPHTATVDKGMLSDSIFSRIYDAYRYDGSNHYYLYVNRDNDARTDVITQCKFSDLRVLNPVIYNRAPRKFGMVNAYSTGTITLNRDNLSGNNLVKNTTIIEKQIFQDAFLPEFFVKQIDTDIPATITIENQGSKTVMKVVTAWDSTKPVRKFYYHIPFLA